MNNLILVRIYCCGLVDLTNRLENGTFGFFCTRQFAYRRRQRIDNQIYLSKILFDCLNCARAHFVRKRIAIDGFGVETCLFRFLFKCPGVIPSGSTGPGFCTRFFEKHTQGRRSITKRRRNAGGKPIATGRSYDKHLFRPATAYALFTGRGDLLFDIFITTHRMRSGADETAVFWFDNHVFSPLFPEKLPSGSVISLPQNVVSSAALLMYLLNLSCLGGFFIAAAS
jgi:hypothetical protein